MPTLDELGARHGTDKQWKHGYTRIYPAYLERYRDLPLTFLEIGIFRGASLRMWDDYFRHPNARLFAFDLSPGALAHVPPRFIALRGDQGSRRFLEWLLEITGELDVVIDDGPHVPRLQRVSFEMLWPAVAPGGLYVIEDIDCSFNRSYLRQFGAQNQSIMPFLRTLEDELVSTSDEHDTDLDFIHFHRHVVVIGKRPAA